MVARLISLSVGLVAFHGAALGQEYVTKQEFNAAIEKLSNQIAAIGGETAGEAPTIEQLDERVKALEGIQRNIVRTQRDQGVALGQIATRDETGNYHWQFSATSQPAREEFRRAIRRTAPEYGKLVIHNRTGSGQWIIINGDQKYINADASDTFDVRPGTATTWLPGQQRMNWAIGLPDYTQHVDINPGKASPIAQRIIYSPPTYIDSWGWTAAY